MKIIVEDAEVELDLPDKDVTLGQVVAEVEDFLFQVGKIPIALTIDDNLLTQSDLEERQAEVLTGAEVLTFGVQSVLEFINTNLDGAQQANEELLKKILTFAEEIHKPERTVDSVQLVEELNHFFDFWFRLQGLLPEEFESLQFSSKSWTEHFDALSGIFEEIVAGMEDQDFVLAADLLQYEVVPAIEAVHQAIPDLKGKLLAREVKDQQELQEAKKGSPEPRQ